MKDIREEWLKVVKKWALSPDSPDSKEYWCKELDTASRDKIKEVQSEKLEVAFRYLWEYSPFYRGKFQKEKLAPHDIRSAEDLHKIPVTTKQEWVDNQAAYPPFGNFSPVSHERWTQSGWMFFATSGTTAKPRVFRRTLHDREMWVYNWARTLWAMNIRPGDGKKPGDVMMICFGYAPFVAFWGAHYGASDIGIPVIPGGGLDTNRRAFFINEYQPTVLVCTPSYAIFLAENMKELGYDPAASSVRALITAGEPGPCIPATKKRIEEMWNATLMEVMGCTEMAPVPLLYSCWSDAVNCGKEGRVHAPHLFEDMYLPESVDPDTFEPVPDGERGMIVASNLFEESQPILRYTIGDYWTIDRKSICSCGRIHARVPGGLTGRADDMLKFKGVVMFPSTIESVIREIPEAGEEFAVEITSDRGMDNMLIKVEPAHGIEDTVENRKMIQKKVSEAMKMKVGVSVKSECLPANTLPRTEFKARRVKDMREKVH